ncbi:hypothetical protein D9Q98_003154 [Chlorella vulgaris]|uniref:F-box domain-containing protein n=1 Tax=Chlorella vulgaris TaxID=3077 RepID=A0A9D4YYR2_CHLVU|nr:hypothetical protein D9Q98_003154 [Chlorella vulgaris]
MIAAQLDKAQDLLALSAVCRDSRRLVAEPSLWRQLCRRRFGVPTPEELGLDEDPSATCPAFWTQLYRYNHSVFRDLLRSTERPGGARLNALGGADGPLVIQMQ